MGSKKVDDLRVLVNEKMRLDKYLSVCEGLHYVCFIMLIYYVVTFKNDDIPYLVLWSVLAFIGWLATSTLEKKILRIKKSLTDQLFESKD
jgi:hypothetical protein